MTWTVDALELPTPKHAEEFTNVMPQLKLLVRGFGVRPTATLLGVEGGTVSNWTAGRRTMEPEYVFRIAALHDVVTRALRVFPPRVAMDWFVGSEAHFNGARPIDVLVTRGAAPLIEALEGIAAAGYA